MKSIRPMRCLRLAAAFAVATALVAGAALAPAHAQPRRDEHRDYRYDNDYRRHEDRDYHDWHHRDWGGPPVVYNAPTYAYPPPPVIYAPQYPQFGITLPGVSIGIN